MLTLATDCFQYPPSYSHMEKMMREVQMEMVEKGCVKELESLHDVDIQTDAVDLACSIVGRYYDAIMCKGGGNARGFCPDAELLKVEALRLLEKACLELKGHKDTELTRLDKEGYQMFRNLVELCEFRKEKTNSETRYEYLSRLERENKILRHSWDRFVENWKSVLVWQKNPQRIAQLVQLRERVFQILKSEITGDEIIAQLRDIHTFLNEYKRSIPATFIQFRTVSASMVAKIASPVTGVPISWLLNSFRPPVACLGDRLSRKVVGQDDAIQRIAKVMSRSRPCCPGASPLASFLFIPFSWIGIKKVFESLAEELYDRKDRLIWFNLNMLTHGSSSYDVDLRDKWNAVLEKVVEAVKNTPFCALLFENVNGCDYATSFLENILKHGKLVDNQGNTYDLSNTLIIMTSVFYLGAKEREALHCNCKYLEMDCAMVEDATRTISSKDLECNGLSLHKKVFGSLWDIHQLVDDILVLNPVLYPNLEVTTRVWLRKAIDASSENQQLILYPSEAAVRSIIGFCDNIGSRKEGVRSFVKKRINPLTLGDINRIQADNMATIHMDVLVQSGEWSYRSLNVDGSLEAFRESLSRWKTAYQNEKRSAMEVFKLSRTCSQLLFRIQNMNNPYQVMIWLKDVENVLDGIISDPINSSNFLSEQYLVPPDVIEADVAYRLRNYSDSNFMEDLRIKLSSALGAKYHLLSLIADAVSSNGLHGVLCCHPKVFLFLGLTDNAKVVLGNALCHLFESANACGSIIQVNMEEYVERDSMMLFVDRITTLALDDSSGNDLSLSDCNLTSPCRVMLIDRVGEADLSVFSALLSLLDHGALRNREGKLVDFRRTVVIIMSDLANKEVLAGLGGHAMESISREDMADQRTEKPFRCELVNRVDEIVIFDPIVEPQLEKFFRLRIDRERVLDKRLFIFVLLQYLFLNTKDLPDDKKKLWFRLAVRGLSHGIARS